MMKTEMESREKTDGNRTDIQSEIDRRVKEHMMRLSLTFFVATLILLILAMQAIVTTEYNISHCARLGRIEVCLFDSNPDQSVEK